MSDPGTADHYEVLQVSPRADLDTIHRVFRHLAKRFHPDNAESGDPARFRDLVEAFEVLSDPQRRAAYDVVHSERTEHSWHVFDQQTALNDVAADRRLREALLAILYAARRNDAERPGVGEVELERLLGCPEVHMRFHIWYLKENGLIKRMENGTLAITAVGVDLVLTAGGPAHRHMHLLDAGAPKDGADRAAS